MSLKIKQYLARFQRSEDGSAVMEFVLYFTLFFFILAAGIELAYVNLRHAMLERAVDLSVREIRLSTGHSPSYEEVRSSVCEKARIIDDCESSLRLEMIQVDPRDFQGLPAKADCVNAAQDPHPVRNFVYGQENKLMLVRACMMFKPIFPTTGIGENLQIDEHGYSALVVTSAFVQEPR